MSSEKLLDFAKKELNSRVEAGLAHYGEHLRSHNGRSWKKDSLEEAADFLFYLRQGIAERESPNPIKIEKLVLTDVINFVREGRVPLEGNYRLCAVYEGAIKLYLDLCKYVLTTTYHRR